MSTATVEGAGVELAYDERGSGQPVVLVHGTASTRAIWDEVREEVGDEFRTIAYDRRGYGESGAPEGFTAAPVPEHGDDLIALLRRLELAPALLCGHSFGAMTCLDAILREPELVRAAVLIEPPMLWLAPSGTDAASQLRTDIEEGARAEGSSGAVSAFVRCVGGPQALDVLGQKRVGAALRDRRAFGSDLAVVMQWAVAPRDLRAIGTRVILVAGKRSPRAYREACEALARMIPGAELREGESGHWLANEAPDVVAGTIRSIAQP